MKDAKEYRDRKCARNEWKQKYYPKCYCTEGRCYYNKCEGRNWKIKQPKQLITYKQLKLWD